MAKFSKEFRLKLVLEVEAGMPLRTAARKYGIARNTLRNWCRNYDAGGIEQLFPIHHQRYTQEFKLRAIEYRWANDLSYSQAAVKLGIPSLSTLFAWEKRYLEQGLDGLQDAKKGRPAKMPKKETKPKVPVNREQELEAQIAQLRMENAYLKKLNALVAKREKSGKKTK